MNGKQEIALKEWTYNEAEKHHVTPHAIHQSLQRGCYPGLRRRYVNPRVVFVAIPAPERVSRTKQRAPKPPKPSKVPEGCVRIKVWLAKEAIKQAVGAHAIYMRLIRGKYPTVERVKAGRSRAEFVKVG